MAVNKAHRLDGISKNFVLTIFFISKNFFTNVQSVETFASKLGPTPNRRKRKISKSVSIECRLMKMVYAFRGTVHVDN